MKLTRRAFLGLSAAGICGCYFGSHVTTTAQLEKIELPVATLPKNLDGLKIAFLTDLHLGPWLSQDRCAELIAPLKDQKPDLVVLGGDYILGFEGLIGQSFHKLFLHAPHRSPYEIYSEAATLCRDIFKPRLGIYGVLGNHDRWAKPEECGKAFKDAGAKLLVNESSVIHIQQNFSLTLIGTDDFWTGSTEFPTSSFSKSHYKILLSHNPDGVPYLMNRGAKFDLALCGHTHGGQIKLPFLGAIMHNCRDARFREGHFHGEDFSVYTSRGIGSVEIPFRVNCPPEVTLITLKSLAI